MGSIDRLEYTVIGDTVNRTARLGDKAPGGQILISRAVYDRVHEAVEVDDQVLMVGSKHTDTEGYLEAFLVRGLKVPITAPFEIDDAPTNP